MCQSGIRVVRVVLSCIRIRVGYYPEWVIQFIIIIIIIIMIILDVVG
jgi:hypothetical protein